MIIDARTLAFVGMVVPILLGLGLALFRFKQKVYSGFTHWMLANFASGSSALLLALRGVIPDYLSVVLGNLLLILSLVLIFEGVQRFFDRPPYSLRSALILVIVLIWQISFLYFRPDINARVIFISLVISFMFIQIGLALLVDIPKSYRWSAWQGAWAFLLASLFYLLRAAYIGGYSASYQLFTADLMNSLNFFSFSVLTIIWTLVLLFLSGTRLEQELSRARDELQQVARLDPLTGLFNRRYFFERALQEFTRARRFGHPVCFMISDADHFKSVNDRYGHLTGDAVLNHVAQLFKSKLRTIDLLARYGGEEFIVLVIESSIDECMQVAERIRSEIEHNALEVDAQNISVTISIGMTGMRISDKNLDDVIRRADAALYQAKQAGRNRVCWS